ncbi:hypothetical protein GCM10027402_33010 [Arthrobacter monumenti]
MSWGIVEAMTEQPDPKATSAPDQPESTVRNEPSRNRYEITVDDERAGFVAYVESGGQRIFYHTEVGEQFSGRGLAGTLVSAALADTRNDGKRIVAVCPYVAKYLKTHHDFDDVLDPVTPAALTAADKATN